MSVLERFVTAVGPLDWWWQLLAHLLLLAGACVLTWLAVERVAVRRWRERALSAERALELQQRRRPDPSRMHPATYQSRPVWVGWPRSSRRARRLR